MNTIVLKVFEAFAGYGSQFIALKKIERDFPTIKFKMVGISEINPFSVKAHQVLHGVVTNYGDISKIEWIKVPDFDIFFYTWPCQDLSWTGLKKGFDENSGNRSSLLW